MRAIKAGGDVYLGAALYDAQEGVGSLRSSLDPDPGAATTDLRRLHRISQVQPHHVVGQGVRFCLHSQWRSEDLERLCYVELPAVKRRSTKACTRCRSGRRRKTP